MGQAEDRIELQILIHRDGRVRDLRSRIRPAVGLESSRLRAPACEGIGNVQDLLRVRIDDRVRRNGLVLGNVVGRSFGDLDFGKDDLTVYQKVM